MRTSRGEAGGQSTLLARYQARYGDSIRRRQSTVALRAARVEAELAYKARGTFLASMNHELRTPLNAITGFAGLLKEADTYGFGREQKQGYLDHILESAELLLSHINTILEVADAESGGAKLRKTTFGMNEVVAEATDELESELAERGVAWVTDLPDALPQVDADPEKIATAIIHLCRFAAAREPAGGRLRLTLREGLAGKAAGWLYVSVATDGPGRTGAELAHAMQVFERVHEGLHRGFSRDDLALPIAKSFVELNGGRFSLRAGTKDEGASYRFALPVAQRSGLPVQEVA